MRGRTIATVALLAVLIGPAMARAGDAEALVRQYLEDRGAQAYTIIPVTDDYVTDVFRHTPLFGVFFRQYPVAVRPPDGLASSNVFYVQDGAVGYLTNPSELMDFFYAELRPARNARAMRDAGRSWLRLSENFSQDLFFHFYRPDVSVQDTVATGTVAVKSGGSGQITATLTFDDAGNLVDVKESREVIPGIRPR